MEPVFEGGVNIALKIPKSNYEQTVSFYKDVLKMETTEQPINNPTVSRTHKVKFGHNTLWLDCVDNYTRSEIWLDIKTNDLQNATAHLASHGIHTCDEIEAIPENMHWIMDPAGAVFILSERV